jgi:predicted MFS family arabinose efflux permease
MMVASVVLVGIAFAGRVTPESLLLLTFLIGCGAAAFAPAWQASIGEMVPREQVPAAIMANAFGFNLARSVGPAIGGVVVAVLGAAAAFLVNALSYLGMLAVMLWWRPQRTASTLPREPLGSAIAAGVRYASLSPHLLAILFRCLLFTVPLAAVPALMPVVARDLLGGGAQTYGLLLGGFGFGAMMGALSSAALRARFTSDALLRGLCVVAGLAMAGIAFAPWAPLNLLAHLVAGFVWTLGLATFNIAVQMSSPRWVMARMLALYQTFAFAGMALGSWGAGLLAADLGLRSTLGLAGALALATVPFARWLPVSVARLGSLDPYAAPEVQPPKAELDESSGPIVVTIEYRVPPQNAVEFAEVINDLGRIRRRDGARAWSASQDIDDPVLWVERFESPTWADHLRRYARPTLADQAIRERLRQLIEGERGSMRRYVVRPAGAEPLGGAVVRPEPVDRTADHG